MAMRIEGQQAREKSGSDPALSAEIITKAAESFRQWPKELQAWFTSTLEKENGIKEIMVAMVEHHAKKEDPDPNRAFPGASEEFKAKVLETLTTSSFEERVRAQL